MTATGMTALEGAAGRSLGRHGFGHRPTLAADGGARRSATTSQGYRASQRSCGAVVSTRWVGALWTAGMLPSRPAW